VAALGQNNILVDLEYLQYNQMHSSGQQRLQLSGMLLRICDSHDKLAE